jgi:hypothetical protein
MATMRDHDSKADIYEGLITLADKGQIERCTSMHLQKYALWYTGECDKNFARYVDAADVKPMTNIYGQMRTYQWPACPENCPGYEHSADFDKIIALDQHEREAKVNQLAATMKEKKVPLEKVPLEVPTREKATLAWMWHNVHWSVWLTIGLLVTIAFFVGTEVGPLRWLEKLLTVLFH